MAAEDCTDTVKHVDYQQAMHATAAQFVSAGIVTSVLHDPASSGCPGGYILRPNEQPCNNRTGPRNDCRSAAASGLRCPCCQLHTQNCTTQYKPTTSHTSKAPVCTTLLTAHAAADAPVCTTLLILHAAAATPPSTQSWMSSLCCCIVCSSLYACSCQVCCPQLCQPGHVGQDLSRHCAAKLCHLQHTTHSTHTQHEQLLSTHASS